MTKGAEGFDPLGRALTGLLTRLEGGPEAGGGGVLGLTACLLVNAVGHGHTCLDVVEAGGRSLAELLAEDCPPGREAEQLPSATVWREELRRLGVVGTPGVYRPLILDEAGRLYLHRFWVHERTVADAVRSRLGEVSSEPSQGFETELERGLRALFPDTPGHPDWQRAAAVIAATRRFAVVSGGPGTGKTHTLLRILALVAHLELAAGRHPRIALAAPTGKAAARLAESVRAGKAALPPSAAPILRLIPTEASTIHRLLGGYIDRRDGARLPVDLLVVDECSMVDVSLMASLLRALPEDARIVLAGDRDQLSSVEAGVVLGDICDTGSEHAYPPGTRERLERLCPGLPLPPATRQEPPIAGCVAVLRHNYRSREDGELAALARATNRGDADEVIGRLQGGTDATLRPWKDEKELETLLEEAVVPWFRAVRRSRSAQELFGAYNAQVVLCALRRGPAGVEAANETIRRALDTRGLTRGGQGRSWFPGLPLMVTVNDYAVRLFNGDIGIVPPADVEAELAGVPAGRACVVSRPEGGHRLVSTARLPAHETAFALTVHKSQGSEFDRVLLVLPRTTTPVLCRELFYTAITRARGSVVVMGTPEIVRSMVERRTRRRSGLRDLLWSP